MGDHELLSTFHEVAEVKAEMVGPVPYPAINAAFDGLFPTGMALGVRNNVPADSTVGDAFSPEVVSGTDVRRPMGQTKPVLSVRVTFLPGGAGFPASVF